MKARFASIFATLALALTLLVAGGGFFALPAPHASAQDNANLISSRPLHVSAARTATGVGPTVCGFGRFTKFAMQQVVTAATGTSPTLDTVVQHSIDGGTTWYTMATFTQRTAAGTELKVESEVEAATAEVYGDCLRISYTIGGTTPSLTFSVLVQAQT